MTQRVFMDTDEAPLTPELELGIEDGDYSGRRFPPATDDDDFYDSPERYRELGIGVWASDDE